MEKGDGLDSRSFPLDTDDFRMYEFKVRSCDRGAAGVAGHDWTDCPFAHPGEKARRRDPRRHRYSSSVCSDFRRCGGACPRGDACGMAHGVFEAWLHPARYRTVLCRDGGGCARKVCFFAHSHRELRLLLPTPLPLPPPLPRLAAPSALFSTSPTSILSPPISPEFKELVRRVESIEISGDHHSYAPNLDWVEELLN